MDVKSKPDCEPVELLRGVALFAGLDADHLEDLACRVRKQSFGDEETIFRLADPGDRMFVIIRGRVRIEMPSEDGPPVVLNVLEPGEFFGELALCDGKPRSASAVAMEAAETLTLSHEQFQEFLKTSPRAAIYIVGVLCDRLRQTSQHLTESIFYDTASRLARRLLELAETEGAQAGGTEHAPRPAAAAGQGQEPDRRSGVGVLRHASPTRDTGSGPDRSVTIAREITLDEFAEMVGATTERIRQELESLEQDQILSLHDNRITVRSVRLLRERIKYKPGAGPGSVTIPSWLLD